MAYARWVRQLVSRGAESDRELAELSGLGYDWVHKWKQRDDGPTERLMSRALARYLLVEEDWLLDDEGDPPRPDLWRDWIAAFRRPPVEAPKAASGPNTSRAPVLPPVAKGFQSKEQRAAKKRRPGDKSA
jgi:hypothetical protein